MLSKILPEKEKGLVTTSQIEIKDIEDEHNLANFGYKQELKRSYSFLSTFSFALSISGLMGTISITFEYPLYAGGPAACVWAWFVGMIGCLCIAWSVAEITSCFPTSGGMYYTLGHLMPKKWVPLACWTDGWLYIVGTLTGAASTDFGAATLLLAIASMATDYSYIPSRGHVTAVSILIIASHGVLNSFPSSTLSKITKYYCIVNIGSTIALIIHLLVKCKKINSASFTFTEIINNTGWENNNWSFLFGFLNVSWVMTSYDATSRIAEETHNAAFQMPLAIASALTTTALLGWVLVIVFTLVMGTDITSLLETTSGQPIVQVYYNAMGKHAAIAYLSIAFVILWFCGAVATTSTSRTLWTFARDRGLPYHKFWSAVNEKVGVPIRCVWLTVLINSLLCLINLGSTVAMNAIFSACAIATDWSYIVVIGAFLFNADRMGVKRGPFTMGKFAKPVMAYACLWTIFVSIIFIFPNYMPVTPENMNYTIVIIGFAFISTGTWWVLDAHKWYKGPVGNLKDEGVVDMDSSEDNSSEIVRDSKTSSLEKK